MTLREYLFYSRKSATQFAKELGISRGYLNRIINEGYRPSYLLAKHIVEMTGGEVSIIEIMEG